MDTKTRDTEWSFNCIVQPTTKTQEDGTDSDRQTEIKCLVCISDTDDVC